MPDSNFSDSGAPEIQADASRLADPGSMGSAAEQAARERHEAVLWAQARQREIRLVAGIAIVFASCTLYFFSLNAYILMRTRPRPFILTFDRPQGFSISGEYHPRIDWYTSAGRGEVVRPNLLIDTTPISSSQHSGTTTHRDLTVAQQAEVRIEVPVNCTAGTHRGELVLEKLTGSNGLPETLITPVTVEVTAGFWRSWFLLRNWAIFMVVASAVLYCFCLINFPAPTGALLLLQSIGAATQRDRVALRMRPIAWLLPWKRSSIPLNWIWHRSVLKPPPRLVGELLFLFSGIPVLIAHTSGRRAAVEKRSDREAELENEAGFSLCGGVDVMYEDNVYRYTTGDIQYVVFNYSKGGKAFGA